MGVFVGGGLEAVEGCVEVAFGVGDPGGEFVKERRIEALGGEMLVDAGAGVGLAEVEIRKGERVVGEGVLGVGEDGVLEVGLGLGGVGGGGGGGQQRERLRVVGES